MLISYRLAFFSKLFYYLLFLMLQTFCQFQVASKELRKIKKRSLMNIKNNSGRNLEPCGTHEVVTLTKAL